MMKADLLKVAVCQMTSTDDAHANFDFLQAELDALLAEVTPDLVCFPENSLYFRVQEKTEIPKITLQDVVIKQVSALAQQYALHIHLGSVPIWDSGKYLNASVWLKPDGEVTIPYKKIHLFDVDVKGHASHRESDTFEAGDQPGIIDINGWKIGQSICYDIRFSELYQFYARQAVDAVMIPAAFLVGTGKAHWHTLIRARAIESQAYVIAAAQGGSHRGHNGGVRDTFGHSMIVDPWGVVLGELEQGSGWITATLTKDRLHEVRTQIPMQKHRRL